MSETELVNAPKPKPRGPLGLVSSRRVVDAGSEILARHGLERVDPSTQVGMLPLAERQRIEIVRGRIDDRVACATRNTVLTVCIGISHVGRVRPSVKRASELDDLLFTAEDPGHLERHH